MASPMSQTEATPITATPSDTSLMTRSTHGTKANHVTAGSSDVSAVLEPIYETNSHGGYGSGAVGQPDQETETQSIAAGGSPVSRSRVLTHAIVVAAVPPGDRSSIPDPYPWGDLRGFRAASEGLSDAIGARVSTENRVMRAGTADHLYGPEMIKLARHQEAEYRRFLMEQYNAQVPERVREWAAGVPGIATGELFPRLLGLLGHPRIAIPWRWEGQVLVPAGEPYSRTLRELWSYCGCGDPLRLPGKNATREELLAAGKRKQIRPLLYTFSSYLVRAHTRSEAVANSKFYKIYLAAKQNAQGNVHERQCQNRKKPPMRSNGCGTVAHPEWGEPGSPWRPGHIDMHAHRIAQKEFLRELWVISGD